MRLVIPEHRKTLIEKIFPSAYPNSNSKEQSDPSLIRLNNMLESGIYVQHPFNLMAMAGERMGRAAMGNFLMAQAIQKGFTVLLLQHDDLLYPALRVAEKYNKTSKIHIAVEEELKLNDAQLHIFTNYPKPTPFKDQRHNIIPAEFKAMLKSLHKDQTRFGLSGADRILVIIRSAPWAPAKDFGCLGESYEDKNISTIMLPSLPDQLDPSFDFDVTVFMKNDDEQIASNSSNPNNNHSIDVKKHPRSDIKIGQALIRSGNYEYEGMLYYENLAEHRNPWEKSKK